MKRLTCLLIVSVVIIAAGIAAVPQSVAPGGPGKDAQWATAAKQGIGTSASLDSKVWFTLAQGVMTEVYYPNVTVANVHVLQFVVVDPQTKKVETERNDAIHQIKSLRQNALTFQQINIAKSGEWTITKTYITDPKSDSVLIDVQFSPKSPRLKLYVYYDPSLGNTGMGDSGFDGGVSHVNLRFLEATDDKARVATQLFFSSPISEVGSGYVGTTDGLDELKTAGRLPPTKEVNAVHGNIAQMARIDAPTRFTTFLTFAKGGGRIPPVELLSKQFQLVRESYEKGWSDYVKTLPKVDPKYQAQFNMAAMVLKAQEDKTVRGANVASLTVPWGGGANANEDVGGGYHLVWARDLYHVFTAYLALGDKPAAERALDFLFNIQQKEDGSFPQNSWLDGKRGWGGLQMDEVGYPLIMAYQLGRFDKKTYEDHVKRAADFLVRNGPRTQQDRWEEKPGYSPSTIAAEIAGLVCAAEIAKRNNDEASSMIYLAAADDWARNIERWTATTTGKFGDGNYYLRITQNGNPDSGERVELNNGAGTFDEREIVDAGFLELVRLGIKPANDPLIAKSVKVIDDQIRVKTPNGESFYRYSHDGYGEMDDGRKWNFDGKYTGKGRLWALLAGERGQYELARCQQAETRPVGSVPPVRSPSPAETRSSGSVPNTDFQRCLSVARTRLASMLAFANEGLMIPEQVWDKQTVPINYDREWVPDLKFGQGTGSATPLTWSMAQFIRLAINLKAGRNLETPDIVYNRYVKNGIPSQVSGFGSMDTDTVLPMKPGEIAKIPRETLPGTKMAYQINGETRIVEARPNGYLSLEFPVADHDIVGIGAVLSPDGSTSFERVLLRAAPKSQTFSPDAVQRIKSATQSPIVSNGKAILFYRGDVKQNVQVAGDLTAWNGGRVFMQKIDDGLWATELDLPSTARSEYKFVVDNNWILDRANPNSIDNGVGGRNNVLTMPGYKPNETPEGEIAKLEEFEIQTKNFGMRTIKVWLPDEYAASNQKFPVMYFQDGSEYVRRTSAAMVARRLIREGKIKPVILVFVDPKERNKEYWANDQWADFIANELVPEIDKRYGTIQDREGRATLGASLGGITSLWIGLKYPDKFSRLGGQSSSFWVVNERVIREIAKLNRAKTKFRFYLDDGIFEGPEDTRRVNIILREKGYPVTYFEQPTGHNWTAWRDRLADAFIALWK